MPTLKDYTKYLDSSDLEEGDEETKLKEDAIRKKRFVAEKRKSLNKNLQRTGGNARTDPNSTEETDEES